MFLWDQMSVDGPPTCKYLSEHKRLLRGLSIGNAVAQTIQSRRVSYSVAFPHFAQSPCFQLLLSERLFRSVQKDTKDWRFTNACTATLSCGRLFNLFAHICLQMQSLCSTMGV